MKKIAAFLTILSAIFLCSIAHAVTISTSFPGSTITSSSPPGAYVASFYQFSLILVGVIAFGVIVYGGIKYMTSAGNPSGASEAKEWIEAALLGLLLLAGTYFILKVVNPQILNLNLPTLQPTNISGGGSGAATSPGGFQGSGGGESGGGGASGGY